MGPLVGIPSAILAGPVWTKFISSRLDLPTHTALSDEFVHVADDQLLPPFSHSVAMILLPVVLMLVGSWADKFTVVGSRVNLVLHFLATQTSPCCWPHS